MSLQFFLPKKKLDEFYHHLTHHCKDCAGIVFSVEHHDATRLFAVKEPLQYTGQNDINGDPIAHYQSFGEDPDNDVNLCPYPPPCTGGPKALVIGEKAIIHKEKAGDCYQ